MNENNFNIIDAEVKKGKFKYLHADDIKTTKLYHITKRARLVKKVAQNYKKEKKRRYFIDNIYDIARRKKTQKKVLEYLDL